MIVEKLLLFSTPIVNMAANVSIIVVLVNIVELTFFVIAEHSWTFHLTGAPLYYLAYLSFNED